MYICLMPEFIVDALLDTLKLLPYLLAAFVIIELLEHKLSSKSEEVLIKNRRYGVIAGSLLGALPQCGFGAMAANLFASHIITKGTLVAIFLSTSDEMLPVMLSEKADTGRLLGIIAFKVVIAVIIGYLTDLILKDRHEFHKEDIHDMCEDEHCHCEEDGVVIAAIKHTLKTALFILLVTLVLNALMETVGEEQVQNMMNSRSIITYIISSLVGLIPNCASSVIITRLYLTGMITLGKLMAGLLTGSGIGILLLFRTNKNLKENLQILAIILLTGVAVGFLTDLFI